MFPESIKRKAAFASSYKRGEALAKAGNVLEYEATYPDGDDMCRVSGFVAGGSSTPYEVQVLLDMGDQVVRDYSCTCPAHRNYSGMCKHSVALALEFLADQPAGYSSEPRSAADDQESDEIAALLDELERLAGLAQDKGGAKAGGGKQKSSGTKPKSKSKAKPKPQPTNRKMVQLLNAQAELARFEARLAQEASHIQVQDNPVEPVTLECTVAQVYDPYSYRYYGGGGDSYELRLRIRRGKVSYVVKCITDLVVAWEDEDALEYGKNLAFVHKHSAFSDRANQVLEFVSGIERAQRALLLQQSRTWYGTDAYVKKALVLSSEGVVALLDILQGDEFTYESVDRSRKQATSCKVVSGDFDLRASVEPASDGGWDLVLPPKLDYICTEDRLYVMDLAAKKAWNCSSEYARRLGPLCETLMPTDGTAFHVSPDDTPVFCERVLPMLESQDSFLVPQELSGFTPPEAEFSFRIGLDDGLVMCLPTVSYGNDELALFEDLKPGQPVRDIARELQAQQVVRTYFPNGYVLTPSYTVTAAGASSYGSYASAYGAARPCAGYGAGPGMPWFPEEEIDLLYLLMTDGLQELSSIGQVFVSDQLRGVNVREAPEVRVDASVTGGLLDLRVDASGLAPADLVNYLSSYRRKQRYVRLSTGDIVRLGDGVQALSELADGLGVEPEQLIGQDGSGGNLPVNRTLFVDALMKDAPGIRLNRDEGFRAIVRAFDTIADSDFVEPESLRDILRGYQRIGFKWLSTLSALGFGGILADDMGLGKTLQVIALLLARKEHADGEDGVGLEGADGPALVVCPASLVYNWQAEIERFAPALDAACVTGSAAVRKRMVAQASEHDVLITSYDLMKRDIEAYVKSSFGIVVLDEAHYIKNSSTKVSKAAKRLPGHIRLALTGTPIENRLSELWSIFDFLMPGILGSHDAFARRFEKPISSGEEGAASRLQSLVSPFILRRLKGDVLSDLPEKNESVVYAVMEGEQDKLYKANSDKLALMLSHQMPEEFAANKIAVLAELTRLRQLCCDPHLVYENYSEGSAKLDTCMELVGSAVEGGHAVLLFSQFTSMLDIIAERLRSLKIAYFMLTGSTSKEERARLVRDFQAGAVPVFLISLKAGGVGLNLTAADIVVHYDPWWNLSAQNQATDRAHRIGQTRDVSVFKLIAKGTIEEKIVQMQEAKRDLAESVIGGEGVSSAALTREDVLALLDA